MKPRTRLTCDFCGNQTERIVVRLYKARKREVGRTDAINYTHRANIGSCCVMRINAINWQPRQSQPEKAKRRNAG